MDWNELVDEIGPRLYRYFLARTSDQVAADLVQDTLVRVLEKQHRFDPNKGSWLSFVFGVASNIQREHFRRFYRQQQTTAPSPIPADCIDEDALGLRRAIASLGEPQRSVLQLMIERDLSLADIAQILDMPVNTIKSHVHRAKKELRTLLT